MAYVPLSGLTGTCVPRTRTVVAADSRARRPTLVEWDTGLDPAAVL